ncbi:hypothetical protein C0992_011454 [Termitomyces sp. T32_za158]|nr:hypothetical protein C0992_011454 [Termitomyces sp. T32_za158]
MFNASRPVLLRYLILSIPRPHILLLLFVCPLLSFLSPFTDNHSSPLATYRPGHLFAFKLLKQTDELLEKHTDFTKEHLAEYSQVLEQTAYFQLFSLDIAFQVCKQLLDRREALRTVLDEHEVDKICDLQVSKENNPMHVDDASDIEVSEPTLPVMADAIGNAIAAIL